MSPSTPPAASVRATLLIEATIQDFDAILATLKREAMGLPYAVVNLRLGSLYLDLKLDPVYGIVLREFVRANMAHYFTDLPIISVEVDGPEDRAIEMIGSHLRMILESSPRSGAFQPLMDMILAQGDQYDELARELTIALNDAQVASVRERLRIEFLPTETFARVLRKIAAEQRKSVHRLIIQVLERQKLDPSKTYEPAEGELEDEVTSLPFVLMLDDRTVKKLDDLRAPLGLSLSQMVQVVVRTELGKIN